MSKNYIGTNKSNNNKIVHQNSQMSQSDFFTKISTDGDDSNRLQEQHIYFMKKALLQAKKAAKINETPIGAVLVKDGKIISTGYNLRESKQDVTLHAEMIAIRKACRKISSWRLDGFDLYVTLEPCIMCAGAIQQAKIRYVYFAAKEPKGGGVMSKANIFDISLNHKVNYQGGLLEEEAANLMKDFFKKMREQDKNTGLTKGQRRDLNKNR